MQKVKCIAKKKDKNGVITQYKVQDINGKVIEVTPQQLKDAIKNKKVECVNLTLTSNNRLVNKAKYVKSVIPLIKQKKGVVEDIASFCDKQNGISADNIKVNAVIKAGKENKTEVNATKRINDIKGKRIFYDTDSKLDKKVDSDDSAVCAEIAKQGYGFDKLVNEGDWKVRQAIAEQGYGLDKLIRDEDFIVYVATLNYLYDNNYKSIFEWAEVNPNKRVTTDNMDIDAWLNSDDWSKRRVVAELGYALDKFINDEDAGVRIEVANHGYGLNKLILDETFAYSTGQCVCDVAQDYLTNHNYKSIEEWAKANPCKVYKE